MKNDPNKIFADETMLGLSVHCVGREIYSYESIDSTSDVVFKLGENGLREGVCVFAEHQKKGRGRLGRHWTAVNGKDVLFSILLRPLLPPQAIPKITLACAVSVVRAIYDFTQIKLGIKWPNDIYHGEKKVAGILTEMSAESDRIKFVVVGIGINVNPDSEDLPSGAASLKSIAGREFSRQDLARVLLEKIDADYRLFQNGQFEELAKAWEEYSITTGRYVEARLLNRKIQGQAVGIDQDGALWIRGDNGLQEKITAGDIQHLK